MNSQVYLIADQIDIFLQGFDIFNWNSLVWLNTLNNKVDSDVFFTVICDWNVNK